ncbi:hypothetical protein V490_06627 [Pseudogymnoascus sp. VKM F-3557]|nr:hypothetical protein V490_06627 [Pseudogymnoascus sp. VKM F-3557]
MAVNHSDPVGLHPTLPPTRPQRVRGGAFRLRRPNSDNTSIIFVTSRAMTRPKRGRDHPKQRVAYSSQTSKPGTHASRGRPYPVALDRVPGNHQLDAPNFVNGPMPNIHLPADPVWRAFIRSLALTPWKAAWSQSRMWSAVDKPLPSKKP